VLSWTFDWSLANTIKYLDHLVGNEWAMSGQLVEDSFIFKKCFEKVFYNLINFLNINFFKTLQFTLYIIQHIEIPLI